MPSSRIAHASTPALPRPLKAPQADKRKALTFDAPLKLESGRSLGPFTLAYQTHGVLNDARSNAILVFHALSGDQFVCGTNPMTGRAGWWETMAGPGKTLDTDQYFIICANVLGGCLGSTGPVSTDLKTGKPYALDFPLVTIKDIVLAQAMLLDALGIEKVLCATGGSMGGMLALQWASSFPHRTVAAIPIATAARHTAQNIALHEVGRQAIMADPDWCGGNYYATGKQPEKGLAIARMAAHISYLSEKALERKFGRALQDRARPSFGFDADFQVESYLRHQGAIFADRFDANSYLYITRAMDYFDLAKDHGGDLSAAFRGTPTKFLGISFTSDWLFPTSENKAIADALTRAQAAIEFHEIASDKGHDAFLLNEPEMFAAIRAFLDSLPR